MVCNENDSKTIAIDVKNLILKYLCFIYLSVPKEEVLIPLRWAQYIGCRDNTKLMP